jgi:hypothetical protein
MTVRPMCKGCDTASTKPSRTPRRKFVLDSTVVVPAAPSGRFKKAQAAPVLSAMDMTTPPWSRSPAVHSSGAQSSRASGSVASLIVPEATEEALAPGHRRGL